VVKNIWVYIRANQLQKEDDKRQIICDDKLQALFKQKQVSMFSMNKYISAHLFPIEEGAVKDEDDEDEVKGTVNDGAKHDAIKEESVHEATEDESEEE
jgi:chromatin remodeling complex protein RSC6